MPPAGSDSLPWDVRLQLQPHSCSWLASPHPGLEDPPLGSPRPVASGTEALVTCAWQAQRARLPLCWERSPPSKGQYASEGQAPPERQPQGKPRARNRGPAGSCSSWPQAGRPRHWLSEPLSSRSAPVSLSAPRCLQRPVLYGLGPECPQRPGVEPRGGGAQGKEEGHRARPCGGHRARPPCLSLPGCMRAVAPHRPCPMCTCRGQRQGRTIQGRDPVGLGQHLPQQGCSVPKHVRFLTTPQASQSHLGHLSTAFQILSTSKSPS